MPHAASMGSCGTGSMATFRLSTRVTRTFLPGLSPIFLRISAGMTIWPFARVLTIGMRVPLHNYAFNVDSKRITDECLCQTRPLCVEEALVMLILPVSSLKNTKSEKVPPVSTVTRYLAIVRWLYHYFFAGSTMEL